MKGRTKAQVPPHVVLDTNCFIDAANAKSHAYGSIRALLAADPTHLRISVSRHTIDELERGDKKYPDGALQEARRFPVLPYFPVGPIEDLLGSIKDLAGTFDDMRVNAAREEQLRLLAKSGTDLRDRGALIDAVQARASVFITSDGKLSKAGPAERIRAALGIQVMPPAKAVEELC
jgi:rRNA-processing protein FCF1